MSHETPIIQKRARSIQIIDVTEKGAVSVAEIYKKKKGRKTSDWGKPREKASRNALNALRVYAEEALKRQEESSRKKKDGWLVDLRENHGRALNKAMKLYRKKMS